jgi:formate/nitrite transporter
MVLTGTAPVLGVGVAKLLGGAVFSVGLMLVVIGGAELFTGNNLMIVGMVSGKITVKEVGVNWFFVYIANFLGSMVLVYMMYKSNLWTTAGNANAATALGIAVGKVNLSFSEAFYRAIGCNWLVCLAVWLAVAAKDVGGKILGIFFPIMAFVASGFEHCIANMYFIPYGIFLKNDAALTEVVAGFGAKADALTWSGFVVNNLVPVTLGNIVGGAIFVGFAYFMVFSKKCKDVQC